MKLWTVAKAYVSDDVGESRHRLDLWNIFDVLWYLKSSLVNWILYCLVQGRMYFCRYVAHYPLDFSVAQCRYFGSKRTSYCLV